MTSVETFRSIPPSFDYNQFALPENVELTFRLSAHSSAFDLPNAEQLERDIKDSDAVVIEMITDQKDPSVFLQKISKGNFKEYRRSQELAKSSQFGEWLAAMFSALYDSNVPATTIDISLKDPLVQSMNHALKNTTLARRKDRADAGISATKDAYKSFYSVFKQRDQKILTNIQPRLNALINANRKLKAIREERPVRIDVYFGSMHRSLFEATVHKHKIDSVEGFGSKLHHESVIDPLSESIYAQYLRDGEFSESGLARYISTVSILSALVFLKQIPEELPTNEMFQIAESMIGDRDLAGVNELCEEMLAKNARSE